MSNDSSGFLFRRVLAGAILLTLAFFVFAAGNQSGMQANDGTGVSDVPQSSTEAAAANTASPDADDDAPTSVATGAFVDVSVHVPNWSVTICEGDDYGVQADEPLSTFDVVISNDDGVLNVVDGGADDTTHDLTITVPSGVRLGTVDVCGGGGTIMDVTVRDLMVEGGGQGLVWLGYLHAHNIWATSGLDIELFDSTFDVADLTAEDGVTLYGMDDLHDPSLWLHGSEVKVSTGDGKVASAPNSSYYVYMGTGSVVSARADRIYVEVSSDSTFSSDVKLVEQAGDLCPSTIVIENDHDVTVTVGDEFALAFGDVGELPYASLPAFVSQDGSFVFSIPMRHDDVTMILPQDCVPDTLCVRAGGTVRVQGVETQTLAVTGAHVELVEAQGKVAMLRETADDGRVSIADSAIGNVVVAQRSGSVTMEGGDVGHLAVRARDDSRVALGGSRISGDALLASDGGSMGVAGGTIGRLHARAHAGEADAAVELDGTAAERARLEGGIVGVRDAALGQLEVETAKGGAIHVLGGRLSEARLTSGGGVIYVADVDDLSMAALELEVGGGGMRLNDDDVGRDGVYRRAGSGEMRIVAAARDGLVAIGGHRPEDADMG